MPRRLFSDPARQRAYDRVRRRAIAWTWLTEAVMVLALVLILFIPSFLRWSCVPFVFAFAFLAMRDGNRLENLVLRDDAWEESA
jgi:hypothetical protein